MVEDLREMHLTAEEVVDVAWGEATSPHLELCGRCREEVETVRQLNAALAAAASATRSWRWARRPGLGLAATVVALLAGILVYRVSGPRAAPASPTTRPAAAPTSAAPSFHLPLTKPAVMVPAGRALSVRGSAGTDGYLRELGEALEPYRRDDFATAAVRLGALAERHPRSWEAHFYLGISRLWQGRAREAVPPLERARVLADDDASRDASDWYLGVALERAGEAGDARGRLLGLCARAGEYQQRACEAARGLFAQAQAGEP